ncbi:inorganic anion antiporter, putative [Plasmodium chabaudi chabaudi]|uniref:Inorganic anion antiporter, putative n=2 Tax=Plasmodium chabaudi TaxID=5825 RepID=A0A077TRB2_PLACU|nr:inorganic anion antiporter, putative [Plasmodium chabaudi chabaudi]SCM10336.1 inorganic anion antiporter, putative [Plasmodium chabaudi adami]SCM05153.1 inorganic anion antiporter, putative [Plasmodium chabaudi chabaudi]SCM08443.1 inorganic anion antiporter, putative [Plasmodium chabaudi chabaudi]SCM12579.1 inorganic anion antiporter, putative [Plasmodium chabaudi adami]VTZ70342.1 inorganic anion antiporter, putative [Plasmodium chabaudi chabaudi]|eukprot:XP_746289.1 inorganic anion antiporter, putative [Plasmodium chabaudi chabaudi]
MKKKKSFGSNESENEERIEDVKLDAEDYIIKSETTERTQIYHDDMYDNDIKICLPSRVGFLKAFQSMVSGIKWGWGFTNTPREPSSYYINEILCGCILCLTMLPEIISFSMIAKIPPYIGLQGVSFLSLITSIFGGSPGVVHGVTGAFASVCSNYLIENDAGGLPEGIERLYICILICSIMLLFFSFFHMSALIQLIPTPVFIGYCNGLSIIFLMAQLHTLENPYTHEYITGYHLFFFILIATLVVLIVELWKKIPKVGHKIPSSLVAITVTIFIEFIILRKILHNFETFKNVKSFTVGDMFSFTSEKAKPTFLFSNKDLDFSKVSFNMDLIKQLVNMFVVLLIEVLMVSEVIKDMGGAECDTNETVFSLFIGNLLSTLGSAVGGSSLLGLSVLNYRNGARGKESGLVASILIYGILLFGYSLLNYIPLPFLCGIMITVFLHCFKWFSIPIIFFTFCPAYIRNCHPCMSRKISRWDAFIIVLVTFLCVLVSVPAGVLAGVVLSSLVYVWQSKSTFKFEIFYDKDTDTKYYEIEGHLFYASKKMFTRLFRYENDSQTINIVLKGKSTLFDYTAIEALTSVKHQYNINNKNVNIHGLSHECIKKIAKMNHLCKQIDVDLVKVETPVVPLLYKPLQTILMTPKTIRRRIISKNKKDKKKSPSQDKVPEDFDI